MAHKGSKIATGAAALKSPHLGPLTEAGRIVEHYTALRESQISLPISATIAKPTNARVRAARQQAAAGVKLAREGRLGMAIQRLNQAVELDPTVASVQHDLGLACMSAGRFEEAIPALRRAVMLQPELTGGHLNLAVALDFLGRETEAQAAYEIVVRLDPKLHQAYARLGKIYLTTGSVSRAEAAFRAAASAMPAGSIRDRIYRAHAAIIARALAEAESLLRSVITDDPSCGEAYVSLGQVLSEVGQSAEAATCFERGIAFDSQMVAAWYQLATSMKFAAEHQTLVTRMETSLRRTDLSPQQRQSVHFALGKAYDDLNDYAAAMRHVDAANQIRSAHRRLDRALLDRQTSQVIAATPPGFLHSSRGLGVDDQTPILIVGMPRSGTTLVEQILSSHPDVAAGGELGFWRERNRAGLGVFGEDTRADIVRSVAGDYLAVLRSVSPDAVRVTDKMPFNFAHLGVIRQVFPRATIVHCRRHPVDTCLSNFATNFQVYYDYAGDRESLVFFYRQYERLMSHWRSVLPPERFIEVDYEDLVADPEPNTRTLIAAAGLGWDDACLASHLNDRSISTASLWQARQPIYRTSIARWRRYEPWLGEMRSLLVSDTKESLAT
jgi:tetratricopeptide (TPR) repeat protein